MTTRYPSTSEQLACPKKEHDPRHYWTDGTCKCVNADDPGWEDCTLYSLADRPCFGHTTHRLKKGSNPPVWQGINAGGTS